MKITIDGKKMTAREGETILSAARRAGISIPTLCHDEKLDRYASCWICAVKVIGEKRLKPACASRVADGMEIITDDEEIFAARKMCLELLLSDHCGECLPPCMLACPAGCDAAGYLRLINRQRYGDALRLIRETVPIPASIGRICPHPCEEACRRNVVDEPASICALKRFAADRGWDQAVRVKKSKSSGKKVAVIGSGPAGLSAAYFLALRGHGVVMFEMREKPGGMLRYGIPEYRLPKEILDREIDFIKKLGVTMLCGTKIGPGKNIVALFAQGFDAALVAVGAQKNRAMRIEGEDLEGVLSGIDFLAETASGRPPGLGGSVLVIGGGDTAIDAARTALRLGADKVTIVYRRSREEMPAATEEIKAAEEEGIGFRYLTLPVKIARGAGGCLSVVCSRMALGAPDESGRRKPIPVPDSERAMDCDSVIMAIGQTVDTSVMEGSGMRPGDAKRVPASDTTMQTSLKNVFAAGDCVTGPDIAISAVAAGRRAAFAIDSFIRTGQAAAMPPLFSPALRKNEDVPAGEYAEEEKIPREPAGKISIEERKAGFAEVEKTLDDDAALRESYRCLECGCEKVADCALRDMALYYGIEINRFGSPHKRWKDDVRHPDIVLDPDKCIKCARCIRVCHEVQGITAWGYIGRGLGMKVAPPMGLPLQDAGCESCGQCVTACPTGAILEKTGAPLPIAAAGSRTETTCAHCGVGCRVELYSAGNVIYKVAPINNGNLCEKGKFKFRYLTATDRIIFPALREGRTFRRITLREAAERISISLKNISPREIAVFVSPRLTDGEAREAQRLARAILGANNIYPLNSPVYSTRFYHPISRLTSPHGEREIERSDAVILLDPRMVGLNEVAALAILRSVRNGARLLVVGRTKTKLDRFASRKLLVDPGRPHFYSNELDTFIQKAKRPVIAFNRSCLDEESLVSIHKWARNKAVKIVSLCTEINERGLLEAGVSPYFLPGMIPLSDRKARMALERKWRARIPAMQGLGHEELLSGMKRGGIKSAFFLGGAVPEKGTELQKALRNVPFVVMQVLTDSATARGADIILPAASWAESSGTFTRYDGKKLTVRKAIPPLCGYSNPEIWRLILPPSVPLR